MTVGPNVYRDVREQIMIVGPNVHIDVRNNQVQSICINGEGDPSGFVWRRFYPR